MFFKLLILCQVMHKKVSIALPSSKWQGRVSNLGMSEPRSMTQPPCYIASAWNLGSLSHSELREPSGRLAANLRGVGGEWEMNPILRPNSTPQIRLD